MKHSGNAQQPLIQISLLSGSDGNERWTHVTKTPFTHFHSIHDRQGLALRPMVLQAGENQRRLGVLLPGGECKLAIFDYEGNHQERTIKTPSPAVELWVCNNLTPHVDGVAFVENNEVIVVAANQIDRPVWQSKFGALQQAGVLDVRTQGIGESTELVVAMGPTDNSVFGIDARTGEKLWGCPGPIARDADGGIYIAPQRITWLGNRPGHAPLVAYSLQHESECRQAILTGQNMTAKSSVHLATLGVDIVPARIDPSLMDSRWQRHYRGPWKPNTFEMGCCVCLVGLLLCVNDDCFASCLCRKLVSPTNLRNACVAGFTLGVSHQLIRFVGPYSF